MLKPTLRARWVGCALGLACLQSAATVARADRFALEGGGTLGAFLSRGAGYPSNRGALGFFAQASYEIGRWSIGVRTRGTFSTQAPAELSAGAGLVFTQGLNRRQGALMGILRYFLQDSSAKRQWYVEGGPIVSDTELLGSGETYDVPEQPGPERVFYQSSGFVLGAGFRPKESSLSFQINYELQWANLSRVVYVRRLMHHTLFERDIDGHQLTHAVFITVGLDVFGR